MNRPSSELIAGIARHDAATIMLAHSVGFECLQFVQRTAQRVLGVVANPRGAT